MRCKHLIVLSVLLLCISCSQSEEQDAQVVESAPEKIGHEAAEQIKATINSAEMARQAQEQHSRQVQDQVEKSSKE